MSETGRIGLISDTHGLLRKEALTALEGSNLIIHAGDVGKPEILEELRAIAPVIAVRGNIDQGEWASQLPETATVEAGPALILVLHDIKRLDLDPVAAGFHVVVSGHSHKYGRTERSGVLYLNPGAAGPARFRLPITVARLDLQKNPWEGEFVNLTGGSAPVTERFSFAGPCFAGPGQNVRMPLSEARVRPATPEDARAIAQVHVESSRTTYEGIFPANHLARLSVEERTRFWSEKLTKPDLKMVTLVACDEAGSVVGFLSGGSERTGRLACDGEVYAIYLLQSAQKQGLGTLLMRRIARELRSSGSASMVVWVLARNPSAKFYEALGGEVIAEQQIERGGEVFAEIAYAWRDLSLFRA